MSANNEYSWIEFYMTFADKLLEYKGNRTELINKLVEVYRIPIPEDMPMLSVSGSELVKI